MINRGSEWRKWDLHLHSLHNNVKGSGSYKNVSEDKFVQKIIEEEISVVGLTNYINFSEEDFKLGDMLRKKGITVFMNLEVRLTNLNDEDQLSDYHIIFSDKLSKEEIMNVVTRFDYTVGNTTKSGTAIKSKEDYKKAAIDLNKIHEILNSESLHLAGKYLTGFLSRGYGNSISGKGRNYTVYEDIARKSDIVIHSSTFIENLEQDKKYWCGKSSKSSKYIIPLLQTSDSHNLYQIGTKKIKVDKDDKDKKGVYEENNEYFIDVSGFTWIKADLTFEGLRQIIYEPEERIRYGKNHPDKKSDYLVLDYLVYEDGRKIYLNSGLNTVIGGRSTGKSTLLNSIAKYQNNKNFKTDHHTLSDDFSVMWRDGVINKNREIEFIPQEFMIDLSRDSDKLNDLIREIIRKKEIDNEEIAYNKKVSEIDSKIKLLLEKYFSCLKLIGELLKPEGDKAGIDKSIAELNEKIRKVRLNNQFSEEENLSYKDKCLRLNQLTNTEDELKKENKKLLDIKENRLFINVDLSNLSRENNRILSVKLESIEVKLNSEWVQAVDEIILKLENELSKLSENIKLIKESEVYLKGKKLEEKNEELKDLEEKLSLENDRLKKIKDYDRKLKELSNCKVECSEKIVKEFIKYKEEINSLKETFVIIEKDLNITIKPICFEFYDKVDYLNAKNKNNNSFIDNFVNLISIEDESDIEKFLLSIFDKQDFSFNKNKSLPDLINDIFKSTWFSYNYIITYQDDEFNKMSQGKKSFVILKLLLEFSDDKKPVLIDQPEDSLDNRAIYVELRKYILETKKERQIIAVTHNPNVVVGSDAENIIIANQHNELEKNVDNIRFQYINGALENTKVKDEKCDYILDSQGIREHIFDILEGGAEAFAKREQKYNFKG